MPFTDCDTVMSPSSVKIDTVSGLSHPTEGFSWNLTSERIHAEAEFLMQQHGNSRKTVLLVEADISLARIMERALHDRQFVVTRVTTGSEAIELLSRQRPDFVVLDPALPDGTGDELLERLRRMGRGREPSPAWIVISDLDRAGVLRRYGRPIPAFLTKPFDPWDLIRVLDELSS
jgi:CheY-like chemotaxis protein